MNKFIEIQGVKKCALSDFVGMEDVFKKYQADSLICIKNLEKYKISQNEKITIKFQKCQQNCSSEAKMFFESVVVESRILT